jgi:hypothetical protein
MKKFWDRVNKGKENECWNWAGSTTNSGYGQLWIDGIHITAHILSWKITRKHNVPEGKCILHLCHNRLCCNPHHLYCGTYLDNAIDRVNNNSKFSLGTPKLYEGEIWLIRRLKKPIGGRIRVQYQFPIMKVAKMFKVTPSTIYRIWNSELFLSKEGTMC